MFRDAITELDQRAAMMTVQNTRVWEPAPGARALVIVADEYAELPPEAQDYADSLARRGRAVAVNLIAATQRPTQKAMGGSAARSQMDVRICLRVRERRDTDLILSQGALAGGWHPHVLTQPGAFLISDPEHTVPERARGFLITDDQVAAHAGRHARPALADAIRSDSPPAVRTEPQPAAAGPVDTRGRAEPGAALPCATPAQQGSAPGRWPGQPAWAGPGSTSDYASTPTPAAPSRSATATGERPASARPTGNQP